VTRSSAALVLFVVLGAGGDPAAAQTPATPPAPASPEAAVHETTGLDCIACHRGTHGGVLSLAQGRGGRGVPPAPDRMFEVRVQCVACHTAPRAPVGAGELVGQTFVPVEQACVGCHGERYRPMLARWREGLGRMRRALEAKLAAVRATGAAPGSPAARAGTLVADAEFNLRYVTLANGAHNVFYAANLLRRATSWLDEAATATGRTVPKTDDALLRGGYCAALCHEPAGRALRETVTFRGRRLPHARHVAELGATCTTCHSADVHRAPSATPATCSGCHHGPHNDRCESCHRAQTAFYRGTVKSAEVAVAPNRMAEAVPCTGCHDWSRKHSRAAVGETCLACHDATYTPLMTEWTTGFDADLKATAAAVRDAERAVADARRARRSSAEAEALLRQARESQALVRTGGVAHNPLAADALLQAARRKAADARARLGR
jgi:hypothetical protein